MVTFVIHLAGKQKKRILLANSNNHISEPDSSPSCLSQPLPSGARGVMGRRKAMVKGVPFPSPPAPAVRVTCEDDWERVSIPTEFYFIFCHFFQELFISVLKKKMEFY